MILTDREIKIAMDSGSIVVDPMPSESMFSSTSLDLVLDGEVTEFVPHVAGFNASIDPQAPNYSYEKLEREISRKHTIDAQSGYQLVPNRLILAWTKEFVNLEIRSKIAARVEGKSSLARLGLGVHITAPTIHSGFKGRIRLEVVNHGPFPITLRPGMKICQLIFEQTLGTPSKGYSGQFYGQQ